MSLQISPFQEQLIKDALEAYLHHTLDNEYLTYERMQDGTDVINQIDAMVVKRLMAAPRVIKNKEWMFNFTSGGWNTVLAKTRRGAIAQLATEYKSSNLVPSVETLRVATPASLKAAMLTFD